MIAIEYVKPSNNYDVVIRDLKKYNEYRKIVVLSKTNIKSYYYIAFSNDNKNRYEDLKTVLKLIEKNRATVFKVEQLVTKYSTVFRIDYYV